MTPPFPTDRRGPRPGPPGFRTLVLLLAALGVTPWSAHGQGPTASPDYWVASTRGCPQVFGTDPWPFLEVSRLGEGGRLAPSDPAGLLALAAVRPLVLLVHGSYYTAGHAASEGLRIRDDLADFGALPPGAVVVTFDWPSQRVLANPVRDANEKGRRAFVAGYHLARFLQEFPPGARVGLIGHSHGGLAVLAALHLLGGGDLDDGGDACPPSRLPPGLPGPRARAVVIAPACDRHWLGSGERFGRALAATEGILCLYNRLDPALVAHPLGGHSDHRRALGKAGLGRVDEERLGFFAGRYRERSIAPLIGPRHTFRGTVAIPKVARWIAPYSWADDEAARGRVIPSPTDPGEETARLGRPCRTRLADCTRTSFLESWGFGASLPGRFPASLGEIPPSGAGI